MVVTGRINKVAFYCRMNHKDRDYTQFHEEIQRVLDEKYGEKNWEIQLFFEVASGADSNRREFARLKAKIKAKEIDVVVTVKAAMLARVWNQFIEFIKLCEENEVAVICIREPEDAYPIYKRIQLFIQEYFEGCD